jgi:TubC N-terminal docking domain
MTGATEILNELEQRGVTIAVDGDTLCLKPRRALDNALLVRVRESKPAILV